MPKPIIQGPYRTFRPLNENETFLEFEGSTITIGLRGRKGPNDPWMDEKIKLRAYMRLEIFPPYINNLGTREFQFIIRDWWLNGKSEMLSELFFGDPRGYWLGGGESGDVADYLPATVTFRVSNHYEIRVDDHVGMTACEIFASARDLEIRNLTSHHLRTWSDIPERSGGPTYSLPHNRIYWQILPTEALRESGAQDLVDEAGEGPLILFHKKPPGHRRGLFNLGDVQDQADYLLAVASVGERKRPGGDLAFRALAPRQGGRHGLNALRVQQTGNVVLSPLYRPRKDLEIRWAFAEGTNWDKLMDKARSGKAPMSGSIRIASPARSLGTADQGPLPGEPVDSCDFPARITYAINYSIAVNNQQFVDDQAGIAIAVGADDVPPRDVTVAFEKPHIGHVLNQYLEFGSGCCTGMHEITQEDYDHGVNFCRYWRTVPLDPDPAQWQDFADFEPTRSY